VAVQTAEHKSDVKC